MNRIILSRKGFDSKFGGKPSPIFRDKRIFSIPIPQEEPAPHRYKDVEYNNLSAVEALNEVSIKDIRAEDFCHFDPNLSGKIGVFGQASSSQTELKNANVDIGDLFLFFGWFKNHAKRGPNLHHIFGWLQISKIIEGAKNIKEFLLENNLSHPHGFNDVSRYTNNTIYINNQNLITNNKNYNISGHGFFKKSAENLILTSPCHSRSMWKFPERYFNHSLNNDLFINRLNWTDKRNFLVDTNKGPGQEFILDVSNNPNVIEWALNLIKSNN